MMEKVERFLRDEWPKLDLGPPPPPGGLRWAIINGGISIRSKLVCPVWVGSELFPRLVVKYPRYAEYNHRVEVEYNALQTLQSFLPPGPHGAPRPVARVEIDGLVVTAETALPARPLRAFLREHPTAYIAQLKGMRPVARWFAQLHARSARPATGEDTQRLIFEPLEAAATELELSPLEQVGLSRVRATAEAASSIPFSLVFNHNDPGTTNIMTDKKGRFVGLIDWESGEYGLPATDLIYFLARYAFETRAAGKSDQLAGYREIFFRSLPSKSGALPSGLAAQWLSAYCAHLGISTDWLPVFFALCWIMHALNEKSYLAGLSAEGALVHGKPATVTATALDVSEIKNAHFRSQLRFFLLNMDKAALVNSTPQGVQA